MKLLIDIGNSRSKFGLCNDQNLTLAAAIENHQLSSEELDVCLSAIDHPESAWVSSVGESSRLELVREWLMSRFDLDAYVVRVEQSAAGIRNDYKDVDQLGVDRWLAAIGARAVCAAGDIIIIDAGTAVTIDWLDREDVFQGGVIIPGYELMHRALVGNTAGIESRVAGARQIIGKTTRECVNSGLSYGLRGAVERIVTEMQYLIDSSITVLLTGGSSGRLQDQLNLEYRVEPNLVLTGLAALAQGDHR